jgi:hypothetical protein
MSGSLTRYFRIDRHDLVYLKFILEAYEGMSTLSTVDNRAGIVKLVVPEGFAADMAALIASLQGEISLTELPPETVPAGENV